MTVDAQAKKREGLDSVPPPARVDTVVTEHGIRYAIAAGRGHKTGFFADQRDNRNLLRRIASDRRVLDLCCNSGGFALNAAFGGAKEVVAADLDEAMVAATRANSKTNRLRIRAEHGDAFDVLRDTKPGRFDLIVLDPPKWAADRHQLEAGHGTLPRSQSTGPDGASTRRNPGHVLVLGLAAGPAVPTNHPRRSDAGPPRSADPPPWWGGPRSPGCRRVSRDRILEGPLRRGESLNLDDHRLRAALDPVPSAFDPKPDCGKPPFS